MKRLWLGIILLAALLAAGIGITIAMDEIHEPISEALEDAAEAALEQNWEVAGRCFARAERQWQKHRKLSAAVADHAPMEDISAWFARLEVHYELRNAGDFAAGCMYLSELTEAMGEAHSFNWWNLL